MTSGEEMSSQVTEMMGKTKATKRNWYIDVLKGIACIGIIFIHCEFPGLFGGLVESVNRWAVPLFFTVSGYYCYKSSSVSIKRKIAHITKIILISAVIYLVFALLRNLSDLSAFFRSELSPINIAAFILVNSPVIINGHLWFLFALIYVYLVYWLLSVKGWINKSYILIPVLLVCYFCISYGSRLMGMKLEGGYWRNWLFEGIPFFLLGSWMHEKQPYLKKELEKNGLRTLLVIGVLSLVVALAERVFLFSNGVHIGSVITIFVLFLYSVLAFDANDQKDVGRGILALLSKMGRDWSMVVYIIHPAVYMFFDIVYAAVDLDQIVIVQWLRPVNTVVWTLFVAALFDVLTKKAAKNSQSRSGEAGKSSFLERLKLRGE